MSAQPADNATNMTTPTGTPATSAQNGSGTMDKLPLWAKVVSVVGVPTAVAFFFLLQSAGVIADVKTTEHQAILDQIRLMTKIQEKTQELQERNQRVQDTQLQALSRMARALCLKAFTTQADRMACIGGE